MELISTWIEGVYSSTAVWGGSCQRAPTPSATGQGFPSTHGVLGWGRAPGLLAHLPAQADTRAQYRPTRPRTDDLCSTGKRLSGLDSKPPPWQDMCAVYRVDTGCEVARAHDGPGAGPAGPLAARKVPIMGAMQGGRLGAARPSVTAASLEPGGSGTTLIY